MDEQRLADAFEGLAVLQMEANTRPTFTPEQSAQVASLLKQAAEAVRNTTAGPCAAPEGCTHHDEEGDPLWRLMTLTRRRALLECSGCLRRSEVEWT